MLESYWLRTLAFLALTIILGFIVYSLVMYAIMVTQLWTNMFDVMSMFGIGSWPN
jgi:hypothetical protein